MLNHLNHIDMTDGIHALQRRFWSRKYLFPLLSLIIGALLPLAFAPYSFYPLATITTAILLWILVNTQNPRQAGFYAWLFGVGFFSVGASWFYVGFHEFGNMNMFLAAFIVELFMLFLALFIAGPGYLLAKFFPQNNLRKLLLAFPALFTLFEWARSWTFTGFPWLFLGYSQIDAPLRGFAPIFGVYGVSFAVACSAGCLVGLWQAQREKKIVVFTSLVALLVIMWCTGAKLATTNWTKLVGRSIQVSLIQSDIPQKMKWQWENIPGILQYLYGLTKQNWGSEIIVWPEGGVPTLPQYVSNFIRKIDTEARQHNSTILTGGQICITNNNYQFGLPKGVGTDAEDIQVKSRKLRNYHGETSSVIYKKSNKAGSAVTTPKQQQQHQHLSISTMNGVNSKNKTTKNARNNIQIVKIPEKKIGNNSQLTSLTAAESPPIKLDACYNTITGYGAYHSQYFKRHLVPFGEYTPRQPFTAWISKYVSIPMSGFHFGAMQQFPLIAANIPIAPFICYEIAYPEMPLDFLPQAQLLLTTSDDSWFEGSLEAYQHLEASRMRSLETGRYQLTNSNRGITAIIDTHGKIVAHAPEFKTFVLTGQIQAAIGATPWVKYGYFMWKVLALLCLFIAYSRKLSHFFSMCCNTGKEIKNCWIKWIKDK